MKKQSPENHSWHLFSRLSFPIGRGNQIFLLIYFLILPETRKNSYKTTNIDRQKTPHKINKVSLYTSYFAMVNKADNKPKPSIFSRLEFIINPTNQNKKPSEQTKIFPAHSLGYM